MKDQEKLKSIIDRAWMLSEQEMLAVSPLTDINDIQKIVDLPLTNIHPLKNISKSDMERMDIYLLKIMRNTDYFPFTCKLLFGIDIFPFQHIILKELWKRPFPMIIAGRGAGKSYILALYSMLRLLFTQGCKIAIIGKVFRQSKVIFEYMEGLWVNGVIYRDICGVGKGRNNRDQGPRRDIDRCEMIVGESVAMALPLGTGEKIRGQRANYTVCDEFASIREDIYQNVVRGFSSVASNPSEKVHRQAKIRLMKQLGVWTDADEAQESKILRSNQNIVAGTAYYSFNHFYKTWANYKRIIESNGEKKALEEIFQGDIPTGFDWRDYSIIRLPVEILPVGFMDAKQITSARINSTKANYLIEYGATFATDSDGFFKRSLIESCIVGKAESPISLADGEILFHASLLGDASVQHVMAIDPASERDNFAIIVLALHADHRRIVYCWTTNRSAFKQKMNKGIAKEKDFYSYCCRKIRDLTKAFPNMVRISLDSQGGGVAIEEGLQDPNRINEAESPIYRVIEPNKSKDTDDKRGEHILQMVNFADGNWVLEANHGLRKDMEDKVLLFPFFDPISITLAEEEDIAAGRKEDLINLYDTLEDCVMDIEELKDELASIVHTQTIAGRDRWDTPESRDVDGKKNRVRKDRYSALLMANMVGRMFQRIEVQEEYIQAGGFASSVETKNNGGPMYIGPEWFKQATKNSASYGTVIPTRCNNILE